MTIKRFRLLEFLAVGVLFTAAPFAPANDNFANGQVLPSETHVTVSGTTNYATQEVFEVVYGSGEPLWGRHQRERVQR